MIINPITIDKITKAFELVCPMFKEELITEAYIVGSVAKGTAKKESDIDVYLINPDFKELYSSDLYDLHPNMKTDIVNNIIKVGAKHELLESKGGHHTYWFYKEEKFHFIIDYESESIKKGGDYIEITKELCNEVNES